ncbi:short-chain specific acyl-CoA dehydrogenase [Apiospora arundinis]
MSPSVYPPPSSSVLQPRGLADQILESQVSSLFDSSSRQFLPDGTGTSLVTDEVIWKELDLAHLMPDQGEFCKDLVQWILNDAKKVFLTLIRCGMTADSARTAMHWFFYEGFDDKRLSDTELSAEDKEQVFRKNVWSNLNAHNFLEIFRWENLAPVFTRAQYNYNLPEKGIFPFVVKDANAKEGAFSWVHKVTIHSQHTEHNIKEVAIKEIRVNRGGDDTKTNEAWEQEARALAHINKVEHPHIIRCLAAIRRQHSRYFMFPWANGNSLRDFWTETPDQLPNANLVKVTLEQLIGLANALDKLHNFDSGVGLDEDDTETREPGQDSIRHGDLKPENLLRFCDPNKPRTLKIGDMGLAKKHVLQTQYRRCITSTRYGTIQYQPPEADIPTSEGLSRLYDTWSMGCVIFEFIIWLLYGNNMLESFYRHLQGTSGNASPYYEIPLHGSDGGFRVNRVVKHWINHLQRYDPECGSSCAIGDLLKLVQEKLLVVKLPPSRGKTHRADSPEQPRVAILHPPSPGTEEPVRHRATAEVLHQSLEEIAEKVRQNPAYLLTGAERAEIPPPPPPKDPPVFLTPGPVAPKRRAQEMSIDDDATVLTVPSPPAQNRLPLLEKSILMIVGACK